jgi:hypothetical protein
VYCVVGKWIEKVYILYIRVVLCKVCLVIRLAKEYRRWSCGSDDGRSSGGGGGGGGDDD